MKIECKGVNGRSVCLDLEKVEAILEEDDNTAHVFTSSDWYKVQEPGYRELADKWLKL